MTNPELREVMAEWESNKKRKVPVSKKVKKKPQRAQRGVKRGF